ncbi:hypothetical protein LINPERHAP2_LOCUS17283 [Linum perenne]
MVCSVGNGRMAVMARILAAGSVSNNVPEETDQQKLAAQWMYRELREADEANLLNAEGNIKVHEVWNSILRVQVMHCYNTRWCSMGV